MVTISIDTFHHTKQQCEEIDRIVYRICVSGKSDIDYTTCHKRSIVRYRGGKAIEEVLETFDTPRHDTT